MDREYNIILEGRESKCFICNNKDHMQEISLIPKKDLEKQ